MWTRQELKERAKERIKPNYWRTVLVSLIMLMVAGGIGVGSSASRGISHLATTNSSESYVYSDRDDYDDFENDFKDDFGEFGNDVGSTTGGIIGTIVMVILCLIIFLVIFAVVLAIQLLLLNPLAIGCDRYFVTNLFTNADLKEVCYTFDKGYKNGVKVMFFRDLYTFLWSLLLVIPGIVKSYEYRMIPYLLAENPDMDKNTAFAISREMMDGNKWRAFVLDLSFILWYLLSLLTCGILDIFYVNPYVNLTSAALYIELRDHRNTFSEEQPI